MVFTSMASIWIKQGSFSFMGTLGMPDLDSLSGQCCIMDGLEHDHFVSPSY